MYTACDYSGNSYLIMDSIVDYRKDNNTIIVSDEKVAYRCHSSMSQSTVGQQLCVQYRDGSILWHILKALK